MQRQPNALQPNDEHEHQPAPAHGGQEAGDDAGGEGADFEERQREHGLAHPQLNDAEGGEEDDAGDEGSDHLGVGPPHGVAAVGLDAVGDADHDAHEAEREGGVARPVDVGRAALAQLTQLQVAPHRGEEPDGHRHQEDEAPVDGCQQPTQDQADERPAEGGGLVHPQRHAALVLGEGVGQDGRRLGHQHGGAHALEDPHDDEVEGGGRPGHPGDAQEQREEGEDGEAEVVHAHPAVDVAQPAQRHHEHARRDQEAQDHPEQVEGVARLERVDADAAEDVGQRNEHDRPVDRRHQHAQRRNEQGHPLVAVRNGRQCVGPVQPALHRARSTSSRA